MEGKEAIVSEHDGGPAQFGLKDDDEGEEGEDGCVAQQPVEDGEAEGFGEEEDP